MAYEHVYPVGPLLTVKSTIVPVVTLVPAATV